MELYIDAKCDVGQAREHNEDMILFMYEPLRDGKLEYQYSKILPESCDMLAVCDGMGGANGGEVASERTLLSLKKYMSTCMSRLYDYEQMCEGLRSWQQEMHQELLEAGRDNPELKGMGCTLVGLCFVHGHIFHINCGDSRLYRLRDRTLKQLSHDHSLREELGGDERVAGNVIVNSIGGGDRTYLDITEITHTVEINDLYVLCSDGLSDMLTDEEIAAVLCRQATADALVEAANEKGGTDNISVCLIHVGYIDSEKDFPKMTVQEDGKVMPENIITPGDVSKPIEENEKLLQEDSEMPQEDLKTTEEEPETFTPAAIDYEKVLSEVKYQLVMYQFVYASHQLPYLEAFAEQVSNAYPQVVETKPLAELIVNILLSNALKRHVQTGSFSGLKKVSALRMLDDADFIYQ